MSKRRQSPKAAKTKKSVQKRSHAPARKQSKRRKISASMNVMDIVNMHPQAADVLGAYGLYCFQCALGDTDSLEDGARLHGLTDEDIENMVTDLEELLAASPIPGAGITVTRTAAEALKDVALQEGKPGQLLRVIAEQAGGFSLEFMKEEAKDDRRFSAVGVPDLAVIASEETLKRIGGATVDFREGRFTLDLAKSGGCGDCGPSCSCDDA